MKGREACFFHLKYSVLRISRSLSFIVIWPSTQCDHDVWRNQSRVIFLILFKQFSRCFGDVPVGQAQQEPLGTQVLRTVAYRASFCNQALRW